MLDEHAMSIAVYSMVELYVYGSYIYIYTHIIQEDFHKWGTPIAGWFISWKITSRS